jgi:hypothetical protein
MTDDQLRAIVRDAVARHLGHAQIEHAQIGQAPTVAPAAAASAIVLRHSSHYRYALASGEDIDGPCLIEPTVRCNHCGYCQSHGH